MDRYKEHGLEALSDRSRRPVRYANQLPAQIETRIVQLKAEKPHWGARKIRELLVRRLDGDIKVPAKSTIHAVLDRHGLVKRGGGPRHRARGTPLSQGAAPNDLWCADFKGEFKLGNGRYCFPLTVSDHASRFLLLCDSLESTREEPAITAFERLFRDRGLPLAIRSDNGVPFASPNALFNLSKLSVGGSGSALPSSASSPATHSRTAGTNACTSPSRRKPPGRQASTVCSSRSVSMPLFASSTPNARMKRSA
jgi:Homeodomain-like domain